MSTLTFKRVERDCPRNRSIRSGELHHIKAKGDGQIIYDYQALENGQVIAILSRDWGSRGYLLADATGRIIKDKVGCRLRVDVIAEFENFITCARELIPTAQELAKRDAAEKALVAAREQEILEQQQLRRVEAAAPQMLALLRRMTGNDTPTYYEDGHEVAHCGYCRGWNMEHKADCAGAEAEKLIKELGV